MLHSKPVFLSPVRQASTGGGGVVAKFEMKSRISVGEMFLIASL
jgi:hypothetical protein